MNSFKLCGLTAAPFTPMNDKGEVDYTRIEEYSKYLASNGIKQIFVNGTTGEGMNLTLDERKKVAEKWMEFGRKTGRQTAMVVHCGALNVDDACDLARHAVKVGADAISTIPPTYFKPNSIEMAIRFCEQVASAAPSLPFYYYHIPGMTRVNVNIEDFLKKSQDRIPTLAGIKFSCCDMVDLCGALNVKTKNRADGRFNIIFGSDEALVAGMSTGADGGVGSTYNFMPGIIHRLMNHIENGNMVEARKEQHRVQQACRVMYKYGTLLGHNVASLKAFMTVVGFDLGPVRSPIRSMTADEIAQYKKDLEEIGFFDWYK